MFKAIQWKTFPRDFIVIQLGFALFGLAIALLIQANLGTSPWVILEVAISQLTGLSTGTMIVLMGAAILLIDILLKEPIGWGTVTNILFIGPWVDIFLKLLPSIENQWFTQILMLLGSALFMGIATAMYIGVDAGAGPRDSLMLGIKRVTGKSLQIARGGIEILVAFTGWILGGPIGFGTVIFALLIGPSVQWAFKAFKVKTESENIRELEYPINSS